MRDFALAEDVTQEVLVKALSGPRRSGKLLSAWLAAVTRNLARNELRGKGRRRAREEKVARGEGYEENNDSSDLVSAYQKLAFGLKALPPHSRQILVLRFYEELSFKQIAERFGVQESSARVKLHRALVELRTVLHADGTDWRACCLVLAPNGSPLLQPQRPWWPSLGIPFVAASVLFWGAISWWSGAEKDSVTSLGPSVLETSSSKTPSSWIDSVEAPSSLNRKELPQSSALISGAEDKSELETVYGKVFAEGRPVAGAEIKAWQDGLFQSTESHADGTFQLQLEPTTVAAVSGIKGEQRRMVNKRPDRNEPLILDLLPPLEEPYWIQVVDGDGNQPIEGASVQVFINWSGTQWGALVPAQALELLAQGFTDDEGKLELPTWAADVSFIQVVQAEGYLPYKTNSRTAELSRGSALPVQLVLPNGAPIAQAEVRLGLYAEKAHRTDAEGFLPVVSEWEDNSYKPKPFSIPKIMIVALADGRIWHGSYYSIQEEEVQVLEDRMRITVNDTPILVELQDAELPQDAWVEARCVTRSFTTMIPSDPDAMWQKLEMREETALTEGWIGSVNQVEARLMPQRIPLGLFKLKEGKAQVSFSLARIKIILLGSAVEAKEKLFVVLHGTPIWSEETRVSMENGVAETDFVFVKKGFLDVSIERADGTSLYLVGESPPYRPQIRINPQLPYSEHTIQQLESQEEEVLFRVDGVALTGGTADSNPISHEGISKVPFDTSGRPILQHLRMRLSVDLHERPGGPVMSILNIDPKRPLPGRLTRDAQGRHQWDFELAQVELVVPATSFRGDREIYPAIPGINSKMPWPPRRNTGWSDFQPQMDIPQSGCIAAFRVPAGHYAFKVDSFTFGGPDGIDFPAGQLTRLEADAAPVDAAEEHE